MTHYQKYLVLLITAIVWSQAADISINPNQINTSVLEDQIINSEFTISNSGDSVLVWAGSISDNSFMPNRETFTFTNCGQEGYAGPSQAQCDSEYGEDVVNVNNGIQEWTVPQTGSYTIEVWGARGGVSDYNGGNGSRMKGDFELTSGQTIQILVGQKGIGSSPYYDRGGGGGGGSFVVDDSDNPLIIAGAGGGGGQYNEYGHGQIGENGTSGGNNGSSGGSDGYGGYGDQHSGGGAGFYSDGTEGYQNSTGGGNSFLNGGQGGCGYLGDNCEDYDEDGGGYEGKNGGFGGGGGAYAGAGGGGGCSGGGGGGWSYSGNGGGGGSFNSGTNQDNESGVNEGHGEVTITSFYSNTIDWASFDPVSGTLSSGESMDVILTIDGNSMSPDSLDYNADVTISSNDPDESEVILPISVNVFSVETSYIYAEDQQVGQGTDTTIPININVSDIDYIDGMIFSVSILPEDSATDIEENLVIDLAAEYGADMIVTQTGPGEASIALSGFNPPLNEQDITIGHITLSVPDDTENGDSYSLSFNNVSGTTEDYDLIEMEGVQDIILTVITSPPEIIGLEDLYLLANSTSELQFLISDDGNNTDLTVQVLQAPEYVDLEINYETNTGVFIVSPDLDSESGLVEISVTNSAGDIPEVTYGTFNIYINHYPVFSQTEDLYIQEGDSIEIPIYATDVDGGGVVVSLVSLPDYATYNEESPSSGTLSINTYIGYENGEVIFDVYDDGDPVAAFTASFSINNNHYPEIVNLTDFHVPENNILDTMIYFSDIDGDLLTFEVLDAPDYLSVDFVDSDPPALLVHIAPDDDDVNTYELDNGGVANRDNLLTIENVDMNTGTFDIHMMSDEAVGGFQIQFTGITLTGISGGSAAEAGFMQSNGSDMVLGFSLTGDSIPAGDEVLSNISFDPATASEEICFGGVTMADAEGNSLFFDSGPCYSEEEVTVCEDPDACNYGDYADCIYPEEFYDCDGNCDFGYDCAGECGDNNIEYWCDDEWVCSPVDENPCEEVIEGNFVDIQNIQLDPNESSGTFDVYMVNDVEVGGFQIVLENVEITGASGGSADDAGFMLSTNSEMIMGFSLTGETIPVGTGVLMTVSFIYIGDEMCFNDEIGVGTIISDSEGTAIDFDLGDCYITPIPPAVFTLIVTDPGGMSSVETVYIYVYDTYLAGDARPFNNDLNDDNDYYDQGEFGDEQVLAPDVINALKIATDVPAIEIPDIDSDLYNAFDSAPPDSNLNGDDDYYDEGERGGDGFIDASDVILSLKRATMVPDYENMRRVALSYPYSSEITNVRNSINREEANDTLLVGNISAIAGDQVQIPISLLRGEGAPLTGMIGGIYLETSQASGSLNHPMEFVSDIDGSVMSIDTENNFLSLLMMDINILAESETLLGYLQIQLPDENIDGDYYTIIPQSLSGTTDEFGVIMIDQGSGGTIEMESQPVVNQEFTINALQMNIISTYLAYEGMAMSDFYQDIDVLISSDDDGNYFAPSFGVDLIGEYDITEGYYVFVEGFEDQSLFIEGYSQSDLIFPINANRMNLIPYLLDECISVEQIFEEIEDEILIVRDDSGLYYIPSLNVILLNEMCPGNGYEIFLSSSEDIEFQYPQINDISPRVSNSFWNDYLTNSIANQYEIKKTGISHPIVITNITGEVQLGDELVAYSNGNVVGATKIIDLDRPTVLSAWESIDLYDISLPGYIKGEDIELRLWSASQNKELFVEYQLNEVEYGIAPVSMGEIVVYNKAAVPSSFMLNPAYPNPFNPITTIEFAIPEDSRVNINIYDINGRIISNIVSNQVYSSGYHSINWNASEFSSGVYIIKAEYNNKVITQKALLLK